MAVHFHDGFCLELEQILLVLTLSHIQSNLDQLSAGLFLARDVVYTSRAYATMSVSVCLSVTEVHWRIIANLGFKFRSQFTVHCGRSAGGRKGRDHRREEWRDHLALR